MGIYPRNGVEGINVLGNTNTRHVSHVRHGTPAHPTWETPTVGKEWSPAIVQQGTFPLHPSALRGARFTPHVLDGTAQLSVSLR